ncbi:hypothetical protein TNCV_3539951 [Trichonephila clavipes]|nr:hypothetical protein TNCV_3539951 [Trichonephila clavipes]
MLPSRQGGTLNSRKSSREVGGRGREVGGPNPPNVLPLIWVGTEPNRTVTCMVLKVTANDRRHLALCHDEFLGQVASVTTTVFFSCLRKILLKSAFLNLWGAPPRGARCPSVERHIKKSKTKDLI